MKSIVYSANFRRHLHLVSSGAGVGLPVRGHLLVQRVEAASEAAVHVEPPVAHEVLLVEQRAVGAEEAVLGEAAAAVSTADVEDLALGLGVSVVASFHLAVAGEGGVGNLGEDGVVVSGHPGNVLLQVAAAATAAGAKVSPPPGLYWDWAEAAARSRDNTATVRIIEALGPISHCSPRAPVDPILLCNGFTSMKDLR